MKGSFAKREALLDEVSHDLLTHLVQLGGYCTAIQAEQIGVAQSGKRVRARLRTLHRLGFLRRVTKVFLYLTGLSSKPRQAADGDPQASLEVGSIAHSLTL